MKLKLALSPGFGSPQSLWERACSRRGRVSRHLSRLAHRLREQARSHRKLRRCGHSAEINSN
ncbi:hypothetical protein CUN63_11220 [Pseudomonas sp. ACM7]|nr:hypothetical protein CUN63_11220 [Pseudomonas sp. ACM7]